MPFKRCGENGVDLYVQWTTVEIFLIRISWLIWQAAQWPMDVVMRNAVHAWSRKTIFFRLEFNSQTGRSFFIFILLLVVCLIWQRTRIEKLLMLWN